MDWIGRRREKVVGERSLEKSTFWPFYKGGGCKDTLMRKWKFFFHDGNIEFNENEDKNNRC